MRRGKWLAIARSTAVSSLLAVTLGGLALGSCSPSSVGRLETTFTGGALGTTYSVKVITEQAIDPAQEDLLSSTIVGELETVNRLMSTYLEDSELSRFNSWSTSEPMSLSPPTLEVVAQALAISEATSGAFDITVGPLVDLWGFGPTPPPETLPKDAEIEALLMRTGSRWLRLDSAAGTLAKDEPALRLDLSAIAKGYAVDRVAEALGDAGFDHFMVEVGGEIVTRGHNKNDRPWRLAVERPAPGLKRQLYRTIEVTDAALATSGDYRNRRTIEGETVSHTIDPRTGRPIRHDLASVSVLAERCSTADAWATALNVLGPEEGHSVALQHGIAALFLVYTEGEELVELETPAFNAFTALAGPGSSSDTLPVSERQP